MNHRAGGGSEDGLGNSDELGEQRLVLKAPVHPFLKSARRGSGVLKAILWTMIGGLATSIFSYIFFSPPGAQYQQYKYQYHVEDGFHNYPSETTSYSRSNDPPRLTEGRKDLSEATHTASSSQFEAPPHVWSSHTGLSQPSLFGRPRSWGSGGDGSTRFGGKTLSSGSSSIFAHGHHYFSKSGQGEHDNAEGGESEGDTAQHLTNHGGVGHDQGGVGHHRPMQGARPQDLHASESVAAHSVPAHSVPGDIRGLDILGVHRACPPIFEGPECKVCASCLRAIGFNRVLHARAIKLR
eukprot:6161846-Pyramimonas_sp.AAC.1